MDVVTLGMAKAAASKAARAGRVAGSRITAIGDSLSGDYSQQLLHQITQRSSQRATFGGSFAVGGKTMEQIRDEQLPQVLALAGDLKPAACHLLIGTNNLGDGTTEMNMTTNGAVHRQITSALVHAGIRPILATITPANVGAQVFGRKNILSWGNWVRLEAMRNGWPLIDYYSACAAMSGDWKTGYNRDGTHPNGAGYNLMSTAAATVIPDIFEPYHPFLSVQASDPINLIPTAGSAQLFLGTVTNGAAGGWNNYGGAGNIYTVDSTDTTIVGNWQTLTRPQAGSGNAYLQTNNNAITSGFAVGDRLAFAAVVRTANFEAQALQQSAAIQVVFRDGAGTDIGGGFSPMLSCVSDIGRGVVYDEGVVPAGTVSITVGLQVSGTPLTSGGATLSVAQPTLVNLSRLNFG